MWEFQNQEDLGWSPSSGVSCSASLSTCEEDKHSAPTLAPVPLVFGVCPTLASEALRGLFKIQISGPYLPCSWPGMGPENRYF